ncbi:hypothetical protein COV15_03235 [Candidatus Woesearchaeota archaeon CG10_big_fil_rev_8_21_14_0_10_34_12]|nr:MAG: hypothetical protein COV15_03235 [Candidatus Woesearchaeota archaeon CG10_big_fil_rev_8_21_14_0_10_34_12]
MGFYLYGTGTTHFNNIIDNNNYVNNKQINVTYNANNVIYDGVDLTQYGQVIVQSSGNVTISNSNISDNGITYANSNGTISNNNITSAKGTGVYLVYSPNSNITSNTISTAGGYGHGVYLYSRSNSNITSNTISTTNSYGYGIHLYISSNSNILTNNTISTAGGSGFGIYLSSSSNSNITSNTISTTNSYGYGIYLRSNSNSNTFDNNIVNTSHITDGWGLLLISNTINNTFSRMNITSNSPAVYVYDTGQNFTMSDSVLHSFSSYDFYAAASTTGNVNFTNVSFVNKSFVASSKGILNVHWYLDVYANYTNSTNAVGANITVWNVTGADGGFVNSSIIGDDGTIGRQILQEYSINTTGIISYFNNYTINASSVSGYEVISRSVNMSTNKYEIFEFDVSPANGSVTYPNESTYVNNTDVNFTINLTDNQGLANATLYIYNNTGSLIDTITTVLDSVTEKVLGVVKTLVGGIYIFFWKIVDVANNQFITSNVTFVVDYEYPQFVFNSPSPANGTGVSGEFMINLSLTETNLGNITYNWNGTNYSFFADSLDLMLNFDNSSLLGENDSYVVDFSSRKGNGSVIGAVWNSSGKYGGGFEFNGVNNSINVNQNLQCPEGMVYINKLNGFCIDKYEASPYNADDSENNSWTYYNSTTFTNNLLADGGKAGSVFNKTVWVYVNQSHARIACENAGKHLCTDEEWLAAANLAGNYYNLPVTLSASSGYGCVVDSNSYCALNSPGAGYACQTGVNKTGSITKCVSAEGVYDMTGNIWEWTNETVGYTNPCPGGATSCYWNGTIFTTSGAAGTATYGNDATYFSAGTNTGKAVLRGGVWDIGGSAGPFCASLGTGPAFPSSAVGFRCCSVQD